MGQLALELGERGRDMAKDTTFLEHGNVEPHALLLRQTPEDLQLFKIMRAGDLIRSVAGNDLHFQRVDSYRDFPTADARDGEQPTRDRAVNAGVTFEGAPHYSAADYYDSCRARTYACSFSLSNSPLIWQRYGSGDPVGKVCVIFNFGKLRSILNRTIGDAPGRSALMVGNIQCKQVFYINYGMIDYVDLLAVQANAERLPNPIIYSYIKDKDVFAGENEFRITLATLGIGNFAMANHTIINFPPSMQLSFNFAAAYAAGAITRLMCEDDDVIRHLARELVRFNIHVNSGA
jgi:hypothetical protein